MSYLGQDKHSYRTGWSQEAWRPQGASLQLLLQLLLFISLHLLCVGNVCILFLLLSLTYYKGKFPIRDNKDFYYYCNILHARRCLQKNMVTNSKAVGAAANVAPELHLQVE